MTKFLFLVAGQVLIMVGLSLVIDIIPACLISLGAAWLAWGASAEVSND